MFRFLELRWVVRIPGLLCPKGVIPSDVSCNQKSIKKTLITTLEIINCCKSAISNSILLLIAQCVSF